MNRLILSLPSELALYRLANVLALHGALIERSGGSSGLRDLGLLESAIARAENKVNYDSEATVASVGASLSYGLIKNHAFLDGNKLISLATLAVFLKSNGDVLICSLEEEISAVLRVAAGEMHEAEWTAWVGLSVDTLARN